VKVSPLILPSEDFGELRVVGDLREMHQHVCCHDTESGVEWSKQRFSDMEVEEEGVSHPKLNHGICVTSRPIAITLLNRRSMVILTPRAVFMSAVGTQRAGDANIISHPMK